GNNGDSVGHFLQRLRHIVTRARQISDFLTVSFQVECTRLAPRRRLQQERRKMRRVDFYALRLNRHSVDRGGRRDVGVCSLRGRRHLERYLGALTGSGEMKRLRRRLNFPAGWNIEWERAIGSSARREYFDFNRTRGAGREQAHFRRQAQRYRRN